MLIYLLRHAVAVQKGEAAYPNDDRPLTEEGVEKMSKSAKGIARVVEEIDVILTSPLSRSAQSAKIAAKALGAESKLQVCRELTPGNSTKNLLSYLAKYKKLQSIMLVGHEQDISSLIVSLLGTTSTILHLKKGALCCIEVPTISSQRHGSLLWLLTSKQLRLIGH
ncbi:MAG TPA: phosphohistidine phosphatase SixA [Bacteroidota bacterium]|nr:phosphohistidine phosphatase SixA [Bacteroidota bacterium]